MIACSTVCAVSSASCAWNSIEDLLFTADVITRTGVLQPRGLAVVSISGGACEVVADRAQVLNVPMPELSHAAVAELRAALPSFGTPHNPLDITGGAVLQPDLFEQGLRILAKQPEFSALACLFDVPVAEELATEFVLTALRHIAAGLHAADMPALMISHTVKPVTAVATRIIDEIGLPYVSSGLHHGMNALGTRVLVVGTIPAARRHHGGDRDDCGRERTTALRTHDARLPRADAMCRWCRRRWCATRIRRWRQRVRSADAWC